MCVNCFVSGSVSNGFSVESNYRVINKLNFPLFQEDWTAEEELLLLEGLVYSFFNRNDLVLEIGETFLSISTLIKTKMTLKDIMKNAI